MWSLFKRKPRPDESVASPPPIAVPTPAPSATTPAEEPVASLSERLGRTAGFLRDSLGTLFRRGRPIDDEAFEQLETALVQADVGVGLTMRIVEGLRTRAAKGEFSEHTAFLKALRLSLLEILLPCELSLWIPPEPKPFVILMVGINGGGKTTTIGKLTQRLKNRGHSVLLAAGDTWRAAAIDQLKVWGDRNKVMVVSQNQGSDSASVVYDALQAGQSRRFDVLIADTAGRLHSQHGLMAELAKVKRVLKKLDDTAPHETLLVIDGSQGQNALVQARQFHKDIGLDGIVITKLDGTAKGGIVFAIADELKLPLRFIGVGEKVADLREFRASEFLDALLPESLSVDSI